MFLKKFNLIILLILFYQNPSFSKSTSFNDFDSKNLSKYFSGIVAFDNKDNSKALNFFNSSKILINQHDPYFEKYIYSLVLENKTSKAINLIKIHNHKINSNFFEAKLLLVLDHLKKNNLDKADAELKKIKNLPSSNRLKLAILESLDQYIYVFRNKKIPIKQKNLGKLSTISETFQRCFLDDENTDLYFTKLFNDVEADYTRYMFFYLSFLIENKRLNEAKNKTKDIYYINTPLLLSQGKSWIENGQAQKLVDVFSCKNPNDIISEFFFLISNLYSSQDNFKKSNFYLNLASYLNPRFLFNLSLVVENQYLNQEYDKAKRTLKNFKGEYDFYYWYRIKKEAQIIAKLGDQKESLNFMKSEFEKIYKPNNKILFDIANFYKNFKDYVKAIEYYSKILKNFDNNPSIKSDLLYRRGGSYERINEFENADKDLLEALKITPDDAYILNYLAYSWLERNYKIERAIEMLKKAYSFKSDDPYIIDSIGWAYYLTGNFLKAENFLKRAVEIMPDDPIVNDHYGDILWKLDRKIQARYFWANVLGMDDADEEMIKKINTKMIIGLEKS